MTLAFFEYLSLEIFLSKYFVSKSVSAHSKFEEHTLRNIMAGQTSKFSQNHSCMPSISLSELLMDPNDYQKVDILISLVMNGQVQVVKKRRTNEIFVAKTISPGSGQTDEEFQRNVIKAISCIAQLDHPAVMKLAGFSLNGNGPTVLTKYMPNRSLDTVINRERQGSPLAGWNETVKATCIFGIAAAYQYIHSKGLVHRSLSLCNILLDENFHPYVNLCSSDLINGCEMGSNGSFKLTMAPELFSDKCEGPCQKSVDVYSFGVILYSLFAEALSLDDGRRSSASLQQMIFRIMNGARLTRSDAIPDFYWNLITRCWAHDPALRPTFDEIIEELQTHRNEYVFPGADLEIVKAYEGKVLSWKTPKPVSVKKTGQRASYNWN
jgi:serine/threonine protein kinase